MTKPFRFHIFLIAWVLLAQSPLHMAEAANVAASATQITVVAGAESHGMVDSCDCEIEPGGGVAKRMTLVKQLRAENEILLLDAGGFSAGGIYDEYTQGRQKDSVRTIQMIKAMSAMGYDAVAVGDDELQFGGDWLRTLALQEKLPLVCANCFSDNSSLLIAPYLFVKKNGMKIGITAVCTQERLFPLDSRVNIMPPEASLDKIWKKMSDSTDVQIILAHTGEEMSAALLQRFPECDLLVNGHRKATSEPGIMKDSSMLLNFGFQGKKLSGCTVDKSKKQDRITGLQWHEISGTLPSDSAMKQLMVNVETPFAQKNTYDLYIMSQCPYGLEALASTAGFFTDASAFNFNVWFIGSVVDDSDLTSLHGKGEMEDEKHWLAVKELYPNRYREFLKLRCEGEKGSRECAAVLKCNSEKIDKWVKTKGADALKLHYLRSMRRSIDASPMLLVNNVPFSRKITSVNLYRVECAGTRQGSDVCASLPECVEDADCSKPEKIGTCGSSGKCQYTDDAVFAFTVITAPSTIQHPEFATIGTTRELFPAVKIRELSMDNKEAKALLTKHQVKQLPFYHFGENVSKTSRFDRINEGLTKITGGYTFKDGVVPYNYLLKREKTGNRVTILIDPFFSGMSEIIDLIFGKKSGREYNVMPLLYQAPKSLQPGTLDFFRNEEALRWIVLSADSNTAFKRYLTAYVNNPGSSNWQRPCRFAHVNPDTLEKMTVNSPGRLQDHWDDISAFALKEPVAIIIDNNEIVVPGGVREFKKILDTITP